MRDFGVPEAHHRGMAGSCRIRLLGDFAVELDDRPLPPRAWRRDSASLVKVLALAPAHHLDADEVLQRLAPADASHHAQAALQRAVKDTRKALRDDRAVTVEGSRLRLWPHGELWVDVHAFAARAKHSRSIDNRTAALSLYRGDLLPADIDAWWTEPLRTRLRLMHLELLRDPRSNTPAWIDLRSPALLSQA